MAVLVIALCVYLQLIQIIATGSFCKNDYRTGLMLTNTSVFRSQRHNTLSSCLKSCIATASCEAFTFNLHDLRCLYGGTGSEFESTTDLDYVTSPSQWQPVENELPSKKKDYDSDYDPVRFDVPKSGHMWGKTTQEIVIQCKEIFVHPCTHSTCQKGSECHVKNNGIAICINTECADSPSVANSTSLSQERTVGITVDIVCDAGLLLNGNPHRTCREDGQWTANTICFECAGVTHYTTYNQAQDHCESTGRQLLQLENRFTPQLLNFTKARCVTCPGDLVADQLIRYVEDDCLPNTTYTNYSSCTCFFTTAVPGKKIRIQAVFLDLGEEVDSLWIFDGRDATFPILGSYTGDTTFTLVTNGSEAFIAFMTDETVTGAGFRLSYSMVQSDIPSSMPTSLSTPGDLLFYVWMDGYINATSKEFIMPNGTVFDVSWRDLHEQHTRLCYDPVDKNIDAFSDTDYCHTYCESP